MTVRYRMEMTESTRLPSLTAEDWQLAALEVIGEQGVDAVSVEGLARRIGVTKGSLYWHFANRDALVAGALGLWEQRATADIIERLGHVDDPTQRLERLFVETFGGALSALDVALLARVDDPLVGPVVRRVTQARIGFVEQAYRELGFGRARAARQARIVYATYIGHFQLRRAIPDDTVVANFGRAYRHQLLSLLLAAEPG